MAVKDDKKDPIDKGKVRVFVYGTLKSLHGNNSILRAANSTLLGFDSITGPYRMFNMGAFPAIMDTPLRPSVTLRGELWATNPEGLAALDMLEGNPTFFARRKVWTDQLQRRAWVYILGQGWLDEASDDDEVEHFLWRPSKAEMKHWKLPDAHAD